MLIDIKKPLLGAFFILLSMRKIVFGLVVAGLLGVFSCKERIPYVLAEQVQIQYYDSIQSTDWIEIDGLRFSHVVDYSIIKDDYLTNSRDF